MDQGKQTKEKAEKLAVMKKLSTSKELFVLMSLCTKMPFVMCDPETFDDEVFLYEKEEDIKREGQRFLDQKIPLQIAKIDNKQFLHFYRQRSITSSSCIFTATCLPWASTAWYSPQRAAGAPGGDPGRLWKGNLPGSVQ